MRAQSATLAMDQVVITLLFCVETFSRGLLLAIIPLDLLGILGSTERVTLFYATVTVFGLGNSLLVPFLLHKLGIRALVASAGCLMTCAAALMATEGLPGLGIGIIVRVFATACIEISLIAFLMARIPRERLGVFEPIRVFFQGGCLAIAPWLGFGLREQFEPSTPFLLAAVGGAVMFGAAFLGLPRASPGPVSITLPRRPRETIRRFFWQPRLRLAWLLALTRSSLWSIFYIYTPIFAVACGWSPSAGAALLSLSTATLLLVPFWGRLARHFGIRGVLTIGYGLSGISLLLTAGAALGAPMIAPFFLLSTALVISTVESAGNLPFLRATRPHERSAMAGIYMTYRDISQFAPLALFYIILTVSQLASAFAVSAGILFGAALLSQSIHPRLR
jgi:hypothetical protein